MKTLTFTLLITLFTQFAIANDCNFMEAQISARVKSIKVENKKYCKAYIDIEKIYYFSEHFFCPLSLEQIIDDGIKLPLIEGKCNASDTISGIAVLGKSGITLE